MTDLKTLLQPWLLLAAKADAFFSEVQRSYADEMRCGPGCTDCCQHDLTVMVVEALAILCGCSLQPTQEHGEHGCALLRADGRCRVYAFRPLICRTHGLAILDEMAGTASWCPRNFSSRAPSGRAVLSANQLLVGLSTADLLVRQHLGGCAPRRVSIRELSATGFSLLQLPEWRQHCAAAG